MEEHLVFRNPYRLLRELIREVEHLRKEVHKTMATVADLLPLVADTTAKAADTSAKANRLTAAAAAVIAKLDGLAGGPDVTNEVNALTAANTELGNSAAQLDAAATSLENAVNPPPAG